MAEYWKSTPKYWCKFCETFVRDTPFAKREHESLSRHQNAIQRSLRKLHQASEREERDKQRAKDEVARLNGIVSGAPSPPLKQQNATKRQEQAPKHASPEERKRQVAQLAEMGVAIPESYRKDMAVAGEWKSTGVEREISYGPSVKDEGDLKPEDRNIGVRKRKVEDDEDGVEEPVTRAGWGSTFKQYRGEDEGPVDIGALMKGHQPKAEATDQETNDFPSVVKKEDVSEDNNTLDLNKDNNTPAGVPIVKQEDTPSVPMFKKRKPKVTKVS